MEYRAAPLTRSRMILNMVAMVVTVLITSWILVPLSIRVLGFEKSMFLAMVLLGVCTTFGVLLLLKKCGRCCKP